MVVKGKQQDTDLCWAGCLEWLFWYYNIVMPQANIVTQVKGRFINQGATDTEIVNGLNGLILVDGQSYYQVNCSSFGGFYHPMQLRNALVNNGPFIAGLNTGEPGHAVVLCGSLYDKNLLFQADLFDDLRAVTIFDPADGEYKPKDSSFYLQKTAVVITFAVNQITVPSARL
ncbi:MAG TPA: papain-like cysteine protease family protein [Blastocatellia bacterium]|nr:papain-like cysteine protease family protein [Blastocatellia bacterium]